MEVFIRQAKESDIEKIKPYIDEYGLDNEDLDYRQFYIAEIKTDYEQTSVLNKKSFMTTSNKTIELAGFGRIKQYDKIYELATIGVIEIFRKKGIGQKIIEKLINIAPSKEIWITTLIPEYFEQFGFVEDNNIPDEILLKCQRVCGKMNKTTQNSRYMCLKKAVF